MRAALQLNACLTDITYIQNCLSVMQVSVHMFLEYREAKIPLGLCI
jgi:hypothetical protein